VSVNIKEIRDWATQVVWWLVGAGAIWALLELAQLIQRSPSL
jgi:hypothetical protein